MGKMGEKEGWEINFGLEKSGVRCLSWKIHGSCIHRISTFLDTAMSRIVSVEAWVLFVFNWRIEIFSIKYVRRWSGFGS